MAEEKYREIGRVHVVTMQHIDGGETETVTKVGVNGEPTFRASSVSKKVAGVTVKVLECEDLSVQGSSQFASKKVKQVQEIEGPSGAVSAQVGEPRKIQESKGEVPQAPLAPVSDKAFDTLKNMVDKIADRLNIESPAFHKADKVVVALASFALAVGIVDLILVLIKVA